MQSEGLRPEGPSGPLTPCLLRRECVSFGDLPALQARLLQSVTSARQLDNSRARNVGSRLAGVLNIWVCDLQISGVVLWGGKGGRAEGLYREEGHEQEEAWAQRCRGRPGAEAAGHMAFEKSERGLGFPGEPHRRGHQKMKPGSRRHRGWAVQQG